MYAVLAYILIGILYETLILIVRFFLKFSNELVEVKSKFIETVWGICITICLWPYVVIRRMIRYEGMEQTLLYIEKKLDDYDLDINEVDE